MALRALAGEPGLYRSGRALREEITGVFRSYGVQVSADLERALGRIEGKLESLLEGSEARSQEIRGLRERLQDLASRFDAQAVEREGLAARFERVEAEHTHQLMPIARQYRAVKWLAGGVLLSSFGLLLQALLKLVGWL